MAKFYYYDDGQKIGPFDKEELISHGKNGNIRPNTIIEADSGQIIEAKKIQWLELCFSFNPLIVSLSVLTIVFVILPIIINISYVSYMQYIAINEQNFFLRHIFIFSLPLYFFSLLFTFIIVTMNYLNKINKNISDLKAFFMYKNNHS